VKDVELQFNQERSALKSLQLQRRMAEADALFPENASRPPSRADNDELAHVSQSVSHMMTQHRSVGA
jgi:hypothetical protein